MFALWSGLGLWRVEGRSSQARDGGDPPHQQGDSGSGLSPGARREPHATSSLAPALALVEFPTRLFPADFLLTQKAVLPSWPIPGFWGLPAERATGRAPRESSARGRARPVPQAGWAGARGASSPQQSTFWCSEASAGAGIAGRAFLLGLAFSRTGSLPLGEGK